MRGNNKWDTEEILKVMKMRMDGATLQEIGDIYGTSRENIRQLLGRSHRMINDRSYRGIYYPNMRRQMLDHGINTSILAKGIGVCYQQALGIVSGKNNTSLKTAFKIAKFLGMTVDEAFAEPEQHGDDCIEEG